MAAPDELVHLLDLEPALADRLREDDRAEARERLVLRAVELPAGEWSLAAETRGERTFGLLVIDGLLLQEIELGDRRSDRPLGRGDLVLRHPRIDATLRPDPKLIIATPSRVALLDDRLQGPLALWPGLALGFLEHAGRQLTRAAVMAAITQLPRVEDRLEAVFWDLADRWGRVTLDGLHIPLPLTHETLARIAGGRRSTITLALTQLTERGVVQRRPDGSWLVCAREPTIKTSAETGAPPLRLAFTTPGEPDPPAAIAAAPWPAEIRAELLDTARRQRAEHLAAAARRRRDAERYAETRTRSRQIREEAARTRAARPPRRRLSPGRPAPAP